MRHTLKHTCPDILVDVLDDETWERVEAEREKCLVCQAEKLAKALGAIGKVKVEIVRKAPRIKKGKGPVAIRKTKPHGLTANPLGQRRNKNKITMELFRITMLTGIVIMQLLGVFASGWLYWLEGGNAKLVTLSIAAITVLLLVTK